MKPVYVVTDYHEKQLQRALLQYNRPQNAPLVREALKKLGREDLIGYSPECLVRPDGASGGKGERRFDKKPERKGDKKQNPRGDKKGAYSSKPQGTKGSRPSSSGKSQRPAKSRGRR